MQQYYSSLLADYSNYSQASINHLAKTKAHLSVSLFGGCCEGKWSSEGLQFAFGGSHPLLQQCISYQQLSLWAWSESIPGTKSPTLWRTKTGSVTLKWHAGHVSKSANGKCKTVKCFSFRDAVYDQGCARLTQHEASHRCKTPLLQAKTERTADKRQLQSIIGTLCTWSVEQSNTLWREMHYEQRHKLA